MARKVGDRFPCRMCGKDRTGEPQNNQTVAVCVTCWPEYSRQYNASRLVPLYLGRDLKAKCDREAARRGITVAEYVRSLVKTVIEG